MQALLHARCRVRIWRGAEGRGQAIGTPANRAGSHHARSFPFAPATGKEFGGGRCARPSFCRRFFRSGELQPVRAPPRTGGTGSLRRRSSARQPLRAPDQRSDPASPAPGARLCRFSADAESGLAFGRNRFGETGVSATRNPRDSFHWPARQRKHPHLTALFISHGSHRVEMNAARARIGKSTDWEGHGWPCRLQASKIRALAPEGGCAHRTTSTSLTLSRARKNLIEAKSRNSVSIWRLLKTRCKRKPSATAV